MSYKIVCAWCGKYMSGDKKAEEISHGICDKCNQEMLKQLEESRKEKSK